MPARKTAELGGLRIGGRGAGRDRRAVARLRRPALSGVLTEGAGSDMTATSSGRTEIWATVLEVMFDTPLTLLTGFGWEAYATFPFRWVTHNHYLQQFFNLGLVGLICSVLLFVVPIRSRECGGDLRAVPMCGPC